MRGQGESDCRLGAAPLLSLFRGKGHRGGQGGMCLCGALWMAQPPTYPAHLPTYALTVTTPAKLPTLLPGMALEDAAAAAVAAADSRRMAPPGACMCMGWCGDPSVAAAAASAAACSWPHAPAPAAAVSAYCCCCCCCRCCVKGAGPNVLPMGCADAPKVESSARSSEGEPLLPTRVAARSGATCAMIARR